MRGKYQQSSVCSLFPNLLSRNPSKVINRRTANPNLG